MARLSVIVVRVLCLAVFMWSSVALARRTATICQRTCLANGHQGRHQRPLGHATGRPGYPAYSPSHGLHPQGGSHNLDAARGAIPRATEFYGLVVPRSTDEYWVMTVDHTAEGYVKDEDAKNWNADELLQSLKDGTEEQNKERVKNGIPALDILGWIEKPNYDVSSHRLVWSLKAIDRGAASDAAATVNYNTYALGREGYFQINLLTSDATIEKEKAACAGSSGGTRIQARKTL